MLVEPTERPAEQVDDVYYTVERIEGILRNWEQMARVLQEGES